MGPDRGDPALSIEAIQRQLEAFVAAEYLDADVKRQERHRWGPVASVVLSAAAAAASAIPRPENGESPVAYLERAIRALRRTRSRFRLEERDEDGYGVATLHRVINRSLALNRSVGGPSLEDESE
ncbi:MAG: hypothetical protein L6R30_14465 [Thermoanaerobaculia bacterium]|nr:hypothetical protein [Thermoanaerobaculia bacterium]